MPTDIINNVKLCDSCQNCVTLNSQNKKVTTEHFTGESYKWDMFIDPICKLLGVGMKNVSKCSHYQERTNKGPEISS